MKHCCIIFNALKNPCISKNSFLFFLYKNKSLIFFSLSLSRQKNQHRYFPFRKDAYCWRTRTKQFMNLPLPKMMFLLEYSDVVGIYILSLVFVYYVLGIFSRGQQKCAPIFFNTLIHQWSLSFVPTLVKSSFLYYWKIKWRQKGNSCCFLQSRILFWLCQSGGKNSCSEIGYTYCSSLKNHFIS